MRTDQKTSKQGERMKIKAIAAAGAIGLGMGVGGWITAGSASADEWVTDTPSAGPIGTGKIICNVVSNGRSFAMSVSPGYNLNVLINGHVNPDTGNRDGLGLRDQPATFVNSIFGPGGFLDGPRAPGGPGSSRV